MNISWNITDLEKPFYASVALGKRDRWGIYQVRGPNQSSDTMFYVHYLKWMAFDAIESVFIYLWFEIILQKYGKGAKYFDHDCTIIFIIYETIRL